MSRPHVTRVAPDDTVDARRARFAASASFAASKVLLGLGLGIAWRLTAADCAEG
ncbi:MULTISPECIES: hypothetical protein [Thauera]|uniref:Uncharacterized protein n=1 Tax=Thauera sinica TaxID=2665146 RepID=A0ABW1AVH1_9RHOO|nr:MULTISPECIES: hypothetical protein [unclassified Thauera]KAI5912243.1 hypothetical protein GH664_23205 [Thauera sp. 2A1]KAI5915152.1 hypothetical protein GH664_09460 [Thauera sp. 2A1]